MLNRRITASSGSACIVRLSDATIFVAAHKRGGSHGFLIKIVALAVGLAITGASIGTAAADTPRSAGLPGASKSIIGSPI
jgi:hypothetical protein